MGAPRAEVDLYDVSCRSELQTNIGKLKLGPVDLYEVFCDSNVQTKIGKLKLGALAKCRTSGQKLGRIDMPWTCTKYFAIATS